VNKWLENLKKAASVTPQPAVSTKTEPNIPQEFRDLIKVSDDGDDIDAPLTGAIYDGDVPTASIHDPVSAVFEKAERDAFRVPVITPPHEDGIEVERVGDVVWKFHWKDGRIERSECLDPALPGGSLILEKRDLDFGASGARAIADHCLYHYLPNRGVPDSSTLREHLDLIDLAWEELLGGHAGEKEIADSKKKSAGSDGALLQKSEVTNRMTNLLAQLRGDCVGNELVLLKKALAALDVAAFSEITTNIIARLKRQRAA
jgi:hypothetical protein